MRVVVRVFYSIFPTTKREKKKPPYLGGGEPGLWRLAIARGSATAMSTAASSPTTDEPRACARAQHHHVLVFTGDVQTSILEIAQLRAKTPLRFKAAGFSMGGDF